MQAIYFTLVAILLYFFSDWLLVNLERRRGKPFANRHVIFFVIIMSLSLVSFEALQTILQASAGGGTPQ